MIVIVDNFCHHGDVYRFLKSQNEWVVPAGAILPEPCHSGEFDCRIYLCLFKLPNSLITLLCFSLNIASEQSAPRVCVSVFVFSFVFDKSQKLPRESRRFCYSAVSFLLTISSLRWSTSPLPSEGRVKIHPLFNTKLWKTTLHALLNSGCLFFLKLGSFSRVLPVNANWDAHQSKTPASVPPPLSVSLIEHTASRIICRIFAFKILHKASTQQTQPQSQDQLLAEVKPSRQLMACCHSMLLIMHDL